MACVCVCVCVGVFYNSWVLATSATVVVHKVTKKKNLIQFGQEISDFYKLQHHIYDMIQLLESVTIIMILWDYTIWLQNQIIMTSSKSDDREYLIPWNL